MKDTKTFVAEHPELTMSLLRVPENPNMDGSFQTMINYHVVLTNKNDTKTQFSTYFSTGVGWIEEVPTLEQPIPFVKSKERATLKPFVKYDPIKDKFTLNRRGITVWEYEAIQNAFRVKTPEISDVLDCLAMDAVGVSEGQTFEDWCGDFGYDTDSRKAENTFNICRQTGRKLYTLLGAKLFNELIYDTERL